MSNFLNGNNNGPPTSISFTVNKIGMSSESLPYDELPFEMQMMLDSMARTLFSADSSNLFVIGYQSSGKSSLIEHFAKNIDKYLDNTNIEFMHFVSLDKINSTLLTSGIMGENGVERYIDQCAQVLDCEEENLCIVSENPEFAGVVSLKKPDVKVILEVGVQTYTQLVGGLKTDFGLSRIWRDWKVVDANELYLDLEDLSELLTRIVVPKVNEVNKVDFDKEVVDVFIDAIAEGDDAYIYNEDDKDVVGDHLIGKSAVPPGFWAMGIKNLASACAYMKNSHFRDDDGEEGPFQDILDFAVFETISDWADIIEEEGAVESDDFPFPFTFGRFDEGVQVVRVDTTEVSPHRGKEPYDQTKEPFVFKDVTTLSERLGKTVLGQSKAVKAVADSMAVPASGLADPEKPLRTMLFVGPTGVGKTQLSQSLAKELGENDLNLIRLDMSEYGQAHEASKLIGSPSGYVGYEEGGVLTNQVFKNPNSVILLDEVEKAHPRIWDSFLQIFDAGRMTDNHGREIDFTQAVIIMTSNIGSREAEKSSMGFNTGNSEDRVKKAIQAEIENSFRPEFLNRIDETIFFDSLSIDVAREIVKKEIDIIMERASKKDFSLAKYGNDVVDEIIRLSQFSKYGARDIQRVVFKQISQPLAYRILANDENKKLKLSVDKNNNILVK